ncbi:hypothetical protein V7056_20060 [Bacillus sp. JJ664]
MNNLIIGGIGILTSIILFGMTVIPSTIYSLNGVERGNDPSLVLIGTVLFNNAFIPLIVSTVFLFVGIRYLIKAIKEYYNFS